jgi:hypothetical protein
VLIEAASTGDPTGILVQYGALGVLTIIALGAVKVLFSREIQAHQRETERADREHEENVRLNSITIERVLPAVISAGQAVAECVTLIRSVRYREDVAAAAMAATAVVREGSARVAGSET